MSTLSKPSSLNSESLQPKGKESLGGITHTIRERGFSLETRWLRLHVCLCPSYEKGIRPTLFPVKISLLSAYTAPTTTSHRPSATRTEGDGGGGGTRAKDGRECKDRAGPGPRQGDGERRGQRPEQ